MTIDVKANRLKWIESLESGEFTPITGAMAEVDYGGKAVGHCCLGVATVVYAREHGLPIGYVNVDSAMACDIDIHCDEIAAGSFLPISVAAYFGITQDMSNQYVSANDYNGKYPIDLIREALDA